MSKKRNKQKKAQDPGLGFSPYRQTARMTQTPDARALAKKAIRDENA
jgi:hypothetical protein